MSADHRATTTSAAGIKPLTIIEWDADSYGIGYPGDDPIFYFDPKESELAGKLVAAYNENAANHVCKVIVYEPASSTWKCVECGEHHLGR